MIESPVITQVSGSPPASRSARRARSDAAVGAVVFMPPTLVASIYGMNFDVMPELHWAFGYPMALALMATTSVTLYAIFKRKGWL